MKTLYIKVSPFGESSDSTKVATALLARIGGEVETIDLSTDKVPFLTKEAILLSWGAMTEEQAGADAIAINNARISNIEKIKSADNIVISYPVWNFSIPAVLKAYIDLIVYMGKTFAYDENGAPKGLIDGSKKMYIVESMGSKIEFLTDYFGKYLTEAFSMLGLKNIERISVSGTNMGTDEEKSARRAEAMAKVESLAL